MKLAQYQEAVNALQKATDLDPDHFRAFEALDKAKEGLKRVQAEQKHQEELLKKQAAKQKNDNTANANASPNASPVASPK
jgi:hypothetical protein